MTKELKVNIWDVEHGHGVYIKTPTEKHIVIDLGVGSHNSGETFSPLRHLKNNYGVQNLDLLILTHPHMDHLDDILNLDEVKPKAISFPKFTDAEILELKKNCQSKDEEKMKKFIEYRKDYTITQPYNESVIENTQNSGLDFIKRFRSSKKQTNLNDVSCVTVVQYYGYKIVIPGDNEKSSWDEFLEREDFKEAIKDADIYLASHHGRESGYHEEIMNILNPKLVIISDSKKHNTTSENYTKKARGLDVFYFDENDEVQSQNRKTLSTHNDGRVHIRICEKYKNLLVIKGWVG